MCCVTWKLASFIKKSCPLPPLVVNFLCFDEKNFLKLYFYFFFISGDRIISVNGESVSGKSYAEVVILIQRLRDNLSLIVVPKQDDILQMVKLLITVCIYIRTVSSQCQFMGRLGVGRKAFLFFSFLLHARIQKSRKTFFLRKPFLHLEITFFKK